jgi:hypothetical protein
MDLLKATSKNDTLDPLSVIIKLFIYAHKPVGTKLSIGSNRIVIQEPGVFQGTVRKLFGDQKNDINIIFFPIIWASKHYLGLETRTKFVRLFEIVVGSFDKLKETYQGNEIVYNIDQLKSIVQNFILSEAFDPNTLYTSYDSPGGKIKQGIYTHINSVWTERRLGVVFGLIDDILEITSKEISLNLIETLYEYMGCIDMLTYNLITNL